MTTKEKLKINVEWERIDQDHAGYLYRAKVPGGYLWRHCDQVPIVRDNGQVAWDLVWHNSITFQPDKPMCLLCYDTGTVPNDSSFTGHICPCRKHNT